MKKWIALLAFISTPAFGQGYVGLQVGGSAIDETSSGADVVEDTDTSIKLFGGLPVSDLVSAEFGWVNFGEYYYHYPTYDEHHDYDTSALYGAAVIAPQINERIRVLGKVGFAYWSADADIYVADGSDIDVFGVSAVYSF